MFCDLLMEQHRRTYRVAGCELRFLRFIDYLRCTEAAGLTDEVLGHLQYLLAKQKLGEELTPEELQDLARFDRAFPRLALSAACFLSPRIETADHLKVWLYSLPEEDRRTLDLYLRELTATEPTGFEGVENFVKLSGVAPMPRDLDMLNITVQQALYFGKAIAAAEAAAEEAAKED
jgi:hypothetical protein